MKTLLTITVILILLKCFKLSAGFYKFPQDLTDALVVYPTTLKELKTSLCNKEKGGRCFDTSLKIIRLNKTFDFRESEGVVTELGCYHLSSPICKERGQVKLNVSNQCEGLEAVNVTYDKAGLKPLLIGSNKYILGDKGTAAIVGKGLKIYNAHDVLIHGLNITDINPHVIWGGDAITLNNATNILINNNYIARIGRQMLVTGFGPCQQVTVSYNEFDGKTPFSPYCDGAHYWLWLFLGKNDSITLANNYIHDTSGRGPHITGMKNAAVLLHMVNNVFENISHAGLIEAYENTSRILVEGNVFRNVSKVVSLNKGSMYFVHNETEADLCETYIGRKCYTNKIEKCTSFNTGDNIEVLEELTNYHVNETLATGKITFQLTKSSNKKTAA